MNGADMDLKSLTDDELDEHRRAVLTEKERRANLAAIPEQIEALAKVFRDGGGDEQALTDALTPEQVAALTSGEQTTSPDGTASEHFDYLEN